MPVLYPEREANPSGQILTVPQMNASLDPASASFLI
jgi:hypothetical protein